MFQKQPFTIQKGRTAVPQKEDSFEYTISPQSFKGQGNEEDLHLSAKEINELFESGYQKIQEIDDIKEKVQILQKVGSVINKNYLTANDDAHFISDRNHEISNSILMSLVYADYDANQGRLSKERFNDMYKLAQKRVANVVNKYEFFLENGLNEDKLTPNDLFKMAIEPIEELAQDKNIKIEISGQDVLESYKSSLSTMHRTNRDYQIYSVFTNIMQNAVKYSPENSVVKVSFNEINKDGAKYLKFSVADKGIGIPKDEQENAINGIRATNAVKSGIQGTGYGLRRVDRIMDDMTGYMNIESPLDESNKEFPGTKIDCLIRLEKLPY